MQFLNHNHENFNIAHFQGSTSTVFNDFMQDIWGHKLSQAPDDLTILSIWTTDEKCVLYQQLKENNISIINCYIPREEKWSNPYKIECILKALKEINTKYVLILDGYDVVIDNWDNLIEKFKSFNAGIVFNASKNNYPGYFGDQPIRQHSSKFRYLNAGCCIGYKEELIEFYEQVNEFYKTQPINRWNSEQYIVRNVYKNYCNYTSAYNLVKLDTECSIFQTFGQIMYKKRNDVILVY